MYNTYMQESIYDIARYILQNTKDGNNLAPEHLYLVQVAVNGGLSELGEVEFYKLYDSVKRGYAKPYLHGVPNVTKDHEGFVYWRSVRIEHYTFYGEDADKREREATQELAKRCLHLERIGVPVTFENAFSRWDRYATVTP